MIYGAFMGAHDLTNNLKTSTLKPSQVNADKVTTSDLFQRIGKTERARSLKADTIFRQLRQHMNAASDASKLEAISDLTPMTTRDRSGPGGASLQMKMAARQAG